MQTICRYVARFNDFLWKLPFSGAINMQKFNRWFYLTPSLELILKRGCERGRLQSHSSADGVGTVNPQAKASVARRYLYESQ